MEDKGLRVMEGGSVILFQMAGKDAAATRALKKKSGKAEGLCGCRKKQAVQYVLRWEYTWFSRVPKRQI